MNKEYLIRILKLEVVHERFMQDVLEKVMNRNKVFKIINSFFLGAMCLLALISALDLNYGTLCSISFQAVLIWVMYSIAEETNRQHQRLILSFLAGSEKKIRDIEKELMK